MADKLTEEQVADLAAFLEKNVSIDAKVQQVNAVKSSIKQQNVPDACVPPLFEVLRTTSVASHAILANAGFTALNHLLTRLSRQEPKFLRTEAKATLPLLIDKLGDLKEKKFRAIAIQALITMSKAVLPDVERWIRNTAMVGKNPRAKEASLQWLLQMHQENGLPFRIYVPTLMELLEDADATVRDVAKTTVIELFRTAPNGAKSDLKKQLKNFKVRPGIEQAIVKELAPTPSVAAVPSDLEPTRPESARSFRPALAASVSSMASERPVTPGLVDSRPDQVEPSYINTTRELDEIMRDMHVHFEGKETEQNWMEREKGINKLRRLLAGNAATDFQEPFIAHVRGLLDGIIKAIVSLRTSLLKEGCSLVQELAAVYGPGMDPMVELLMQTFVKLSASTKKISSQMANVSVDIIIAQVTYNPRILFHVSGACQDKNITPRLCASGWLTTLIKKEAGRKTHFEHTGGVDVVEKCIKKGLADPNPGVREKMRAAYWTFAGIWPAKGEAMMEALDASAQKLLQKDANNPNASKPTAASPRPGLGLSKSTMGTSKPSLREAMMAQKKALAAKGLPARPGSAMAHFSPVRIVSGSSTATSASTATSKPPVRLRADASAPSATNSLSVAPKRPVKMRVETARPATAGPYSVRSHGGPAREQSSPPEKGRQNAVTPKSTIAGSPRRTAPRPRMGHAATASEGNVISPSRIPAASPGAAPSPRLATSKSKPVRSPELSPPASSPRRRNEDLTDVFPSINGQLGNVGVENVDPTLKASPAFATADIPNEMPEDQDTIIDAPLTTPSKTLQVYEDPDADESSTPRPAITRPVLEDKLVNESVANLPRLGSEVAGDGDGAASVGLLPDKTKQNSRLFDSGIAKVKAQSLDVHGFRKLQGIIRDTKTSIADDKFDSLLNGLFEFLENPLQQMPVEKAADVKAQILSTIKLLLKRSRENFQPHVSRGLESLLEARCSYEARTHVVSGMELLADELVTIGDAPEIALVLSRAMASRDMDTRGCRSLGMGLHVLAQLIDLRTEFHPSESELDMITSLATRCLDSSESAVRMDAVQLCVALHARVGDTRFWDALRSVKDDPKSLITYYIVKRQREREASGGSGAGTVASLTVMPSLA